MGAIKWESLGDFIGICTLARQEPLLQSRHIFEDPTMKRGMINLHTPFSHHFLDLPVADRIRHIPAHAPQDDFALKMAPFERDRHHPSYSNSGHTIYRAAAS